MGIAGPTKGEMLLAVLIMIAIGAGLGIAGFVGCHWVREHVEVRVR